MSWYAIYVETGYEDEVCFFINKVITYLFDDIQFNLLVPKRKIYEKKQGIRKEVIKRMFPGYVLVETDKIYEFYCKVRGVPHILKFLRDNFDFLEVRVEEISQILHMTNQDGLIGISQAFVINDKIKVTKGPLSGREGIIQKIDKRKGRAKVEFSIHDNKLLIDLGIDIIDKFKMEDTS
jgi:transcriptional antiterminator NusG